MILLQQADPICIPRHALSAQIALIAPSALHFDSNLLHLIPYHPFTKSHSQKGPEYRALLQWSNLFCCYDLGLNIKCNIITIA